MASQRLDKLAIIFSSVCLLHCLAVPVAITLLPMTSLGLFAEEVVFHKLMLWVVIPTSIVGLFLGCRKHRRFSIAATGALGLIIVILAVTLGHDMLSLRAEKLMTVAGGLVLAFSHYLNFKACQAITCESNDCAEKHHH